jgi:hypothetical protein
MSRTITTEPVARFSGPPAERMVGRAQARAARAAAKPQGNYAPGSAGVKAAVEARANAFLRREELLDNAIHQGIISTSLRAHFAALWDADPDGTRAHLESIGLAKTLQASAATAPDAYDESALSAAERGRIAAAREGRGPRIINGGL